MNLLAEDVPDADDNALAKPADGEPASPVVISQVAELDAATAAAAVDKLCGQGLATLAGLRFSSHHHTENATTSCRTAATCSAGAKAAG
ncbi:hypothetical protein ACFPOI_34460 [Nonomuraea angiospora]|uniref:Uncharacterized protein n=1 Tax=Nonomuraea angiospora TaxID=46172 RepID=A0ABR9LUJ5_9ACTN|nr:hypothetical protein [Nonomuraea angiospora]MBE1583948.1 hypothetical protein [Nonomuraea angiospora]